MIPVLKVIAGNGTELDRKTDRLSGGDLIQMLTVLSTLLEKEMATHSSILAWKILWTEEPGGLQSMGHKESDTTE